MISRDNLLKIFKKYGYNSKTVHPFIFADKSKVGVNYSYIDDIYGIVERIAIFNSEIDADSFLKRYQWYKLNGKNNNVHVELDNYEIDNPKIIYNRNGHVMTDWEMFNINEFDKKNLKNMKMSHTKRIVLEISDLLNHYYLKKDEVLKIVNLYLNKEEELKRYYISLQDLVNEYTNNKVKIEYSNDVVDFNLNINNESDINIKLAKLKDENPKEADAYDLLNEVWELNKCLELNQDYLNALKNNDDIDEELRLVVTKIDFMKELLKKKRFWFTPRVNLKKKFNNIDLSSTYVSRYDNSFDAKVTDFINEKYAAKEKINEFKLCEYLDDFTGNKEYDILKNIRLCQNEKNNNDVIVNNYNLIYDDLKKQFNNNLTADEQNALILYTSIYKDIVNMIMGVNYYNEISISKLISLLNITDGFLNIYNQSYNNVKGLLALKENENIKCDLFKNVCFDSKEKFIKSIRDMVNVISNINSKIVLNYNTYLYYSINDINNLNKETFINTSNNICPFINTSNNRVIIANVYKGINVLFSPKYLKLPGENAYKQNVEVIDEPNPEIIIDSKDINIVKDNSNVIFSKFRSNMVNQNDYTYVDSFNLDYKVNINKINIEKRISNE